MNNENAVQILDGCQYCSLKDGEESPYGKSWIVRKYGGFFLESGDDYLTSLNYCPHCGRDFSKAKPTEKVVECAITVYHVDESKHALNIHSNDICCSDETIIEEIIPQEYKSILSSSFVKIHFINLEKDVVGLDCLRGKIKDFMKAHEYSFSVNIYVYPLGFPETSELDNLITVYYSDEYVTNSKSVKKFLVSDITFKAAVEYFGGTLKQTSQIFAAGEMVKEDDFLSKYLDYDEQNHPFIDILHYQKMINP